MSVVAYPNENVVCWSYASIDAIGGMPDKIIMYNYSPNSTVRWSYANITTWSLVTPLSQGYTLEGLDAVNTNLDLLPFSLDSQVWVGLILSVGLSTK